MGNRSKQKGSRFERECADFLSDNGFPECDRRVLKGTADEGDLAGVRGWTLECKNEKRMNIAGAVDEAKVEAENAGTERYAAIVKRPRKNVSESYVVMPLHLFAKIFGESDESA